MIERENLKRILIEAENAFKKGDPFQLKKLSNKTIHTSSSTGDPDNILVAVVIYSLGKILEREDYKIMEGWKNFETLVGSSLKTSIKDLETKNDEKFRRDFIQIRKAINKIDGKLKRYIEDVFRKFEINKT